MKRSMNKTKFSKLRQVTLIGLALLVAGLAVLLVLSPDVVMADKPDKPGKPDKPPGKGEPGLYRVYMSTYDQAMGINTDMGCNPCGYVLAEWDDAHNFLHANGTMIDPDFDERIPLLMQLLTDVEWTREYPAKDSGVFDGCYGETVGEHGYHGALFITFSKKRKETYIRFTWYFGYYTATDVREHFALFSDDIPFQKWTGENLSGEVNGRFDLQYYLNDPDNLPSYTSLTDDVGRTFNFWISIEKISQ